LSTFRVATKLHAAEFLRSWQSLILSRNSIFFIECEYPATELSFILRQLNPNHALTHSAFRIHFNKILMLSCHPLPNPLHHFFR
jgi:hypothetical protein